MRVDIEFVDLLNVWLDAYPDRNEGEMRKHFNLSPCPHMETDAEGNCLDCGGA